MTSPMSADTPRPHVVMTAPPLRHGFLTRQSLPCPGPVLPAHGHRGGPLRNLWRWASGIMLSRGVHPPLAHTLPGPPVATINFINVSNDGLAGVSMTREEVHSLLLKVPGMTEEIAGRLFDAGFTDRDRLYNATVAEFEGVEGIDTVMANNIQSIVRKGVISSETKEESGVAEGVEEETKESAPEGGVLGMIMGIVNGILDAIKGILGTILGKAKGAKTAYPSTGDAETAPEAGADRAAPGTTPEAPAEPTPPPPPEAPAAGTQETGSPTPPPATGEATPAPSTESAPLPTSAESAASSGPTAVPEEAVRALREAFEIEESAARSLVAAGYVDVESVRSADIIDLAEVDGITLAVAKRIKAK
ncbi:MAG TPA: hypothetical protein EYP43_03685 [Thermoplasmata archaeon]|nr:hypothetical protein [Thermoplasmata archaeon]